MEEQCFSILGSKPKIIFVSPLEKGVHPELCTSKCLDQDGIQKHQLLIGDIKWSASLGRLDINTAVMTLASFRSEPR